MKAKLSRASNDKSCPAPSGMAPSLATQREAAPTLSGQESFDSIKAPASVFGQPCPELWMTCFALDLQFISTPFLTLANKFLKSCCTLYIEHLMHAILFCSLAIFLWRREEGTYKCRKEEPLPISLFGSYFDISQMLSLAADCQWGARHVGDECASRKAYRTIGRRLVGKSEGGGKFCSRASCTFWFSSFFLAHKIE